MASSSYHEIMSCGTRSRREAKICLTSALSLCFMKHSSEIIFNKWKRERDEINKRAHNFWEAALNKAAVLAHPMRLSPLFSISFETCSLESRSIIKKYINYLAVADVNIMKPLSFKFVIVFIKKHTQYSIYRRRNLSTACISARLFNL